MFCAKLNTPVAGKNAMRGTCLFTRDDRCACTPEEPDCPEYSKTIAVRNGMDKEPVLRPRSCCSFKYPDTNLYDIIDGSLRLRLTLRTCSDGSCCLNAASAESSSHPASYPLWAAIQGAKLRLGDDWTQSPDPALGIVPCRVVDIRDEILHAVLAANSAGLRARDAAVK